MTKRIEESDIELGNTLYDQCFSSPCNWPGACFLKVPKRFRTRRVIAKSQTWLQSCFWHIVKINRDSLHTRSFRRMQLSVFRYRLTKNALVGAKRFGSFRETGPPITCYERRRSRGLMSSSLMWRHYSKHFNLTRHEYLSHQELAWKLATIWISILEWMPRR